MAKIMLGGSATYGIGSMANNQHNPLQADKHLYFEEIAISEEESDQEKEPEHDSDDPIQEEEIKIESQWEDDNHDV